MTRFDEVARLMGLEKKEDGGWFYTCHPKKDTAVIWGSDGDEIATIHGNLGLDVSEEDRAQFILSAKDDLPWLLEAAACFQPGDAELIGEWLYQLEEEYGSDGESPNQPITRMLARLQKAAALLEELREVDPGEWDNLTMWNVNKELPETSPLSMFIIQNSIQRACERREWALTLEYVSWYAPARRWHAYISTGPRGCDTKDTAADSAAEALLMAYIAAVREEAEK